MLIPIYVKENFRRINRTLKLKTNYRFCFPFLELQEFLVSDRKLLTQEDLTTLEFKWDVNNTKLIDFFGKYRKQVGTFKLKGLKQMWQEISEQLTEIVGTT